jgi:hypothetical protein
MQFHDSESGQALILAVALFSVGITLFLGIFSLSMAVKEKIRLQLSADLAVLTALNIQANALNAMALGNRAILSNEAMVAQTNALVSEVTFYRKLIEEFSRILRFIPSSGPILGELFSRGGRALEMLARRGATILIPSAWTYNGLIEMEREMILKTLPLLSLKGARDVTAGNFPRAAISSPSQALLVKQAYNLSNLITPLDEKEMGRILRSTLDPHTLRRNWNIGPGSLPFSVRKRGGSRILADDFYAHDRLSIRTLKRLRPRWKTVIAASSKASNFGYRTHKELKNLGNENPSTSLTLMLISEPPPVSPGLAGIGRAFFAVSSGGLYYRRPDKPDEGPNLLNPFWHSRLIPISGERNAEKIVPGPLLREIRH